MISSLDTILKITAGDNDKPVNIEINSKKKVLSYNWEIKDSREEVKASGKGSVNENAFSFEASFAADMWSINTPVLYSLSVTLYYEDNTEETLSDRFGFRTFYSDEKYIYLNSYPFYMRAYIRGCSAHEHKNNCNLTEYEYYKKNFLAAKSYGFNAVRFHSVIPPEACFCAADELGMLIHIETRKEKSEYDNLQEMLNGYDDLIADSELLKVINTLYNHPSLMVYCIGNELRSPSKNPRIREICELIKKNDPTRLFIDTCAHGEYDRTYVDFDVQHMGYFFPYGRNANMFENTENLLCFGNSKGLPMVMENGCDKIRRAISFKRPVLAHETCHYVSWRDFYALRDKFEKYGIEKPWWIEEEIKMLEEKGYKEEFPKLLQVTKNFQTRCWKTAIEGIRASKLLAGFHMLQFADTDKYENSNGIVDCFDDYQGVEEEEFKKFNSDTVIVARLPKNSFFGEDTVKIPVILSQFLISPPTTGTFSYSLDGEKKVYSKGEMEGAETGESGIYDICTLEIKLPNIKKAEKLTLNCSLLFCDGTKTSNSWELWVFPKDNKSLNIKAHYDMEKDYLKNFITNDNESDFVITDKLNDKLFDYLEEGKSVFLLYRTDWTRHLLNKGIEAPKYSFRHTWDRFKGVIWDRGTINGGIDDAELLTKYGFPSDGEINYHYYNLIDDSDKINLDDFPVKLKSIIRGLDKCNRDRFDPDMFGERELMYDRTMRNFSYVFEISVGKGKLLVSGLNFTGAENDEPASIAMLKALSDYIKSTDFNPSAKIESDALKEYLAKVSKEGPQKERMMTQYWQYDCEPVESDRYWKEAEIYLKEN